MSQQFPAIYENGVLRPEHPLDLADGQRVTVTIDEAALFDDDLSDIADLLDIEFMEECRKKAAQAPSLEEVRRILSAYKGSLSDLIIQDRDEQGVA